MFKWLQTKGENSRVYMCIKEVQSDLEVLSSPLRTAQILIMANLLRESFGDPEILNNPFAYSRNDLMNFYCDLEDIRNQSSAQQAHLQDFIKLHGTSVLETANNRFKISRRAIEIWMCTVGAGICPERRDDVRKIWKMLSQVKLNIPDALAELQRVDALGPDPDNSEFRALNTSQCKEICEFVPSIFQKE